MNSERVCRRCLLLEMGKEDILAEIRVRIEKISQAEKTDEKEYTRRLEICQSCDELIDATCLKCGCYPEFRAAFIKNKCPIKKW